MRKKAWEPRSAIGEARNLPKTLGLPERARQIVSSDIALFIIALGLGPLFIFPRERWLWMLFIVPLIWIGRGILGFRWLRRTPIDGAVALIAFWAFLGTFRVSDIEESTAKLAGFVYGIVVFYVVVESVKSFGRIKIAVAVFLVAGFIVASVGTINRPQDRYKPPKKGITNIVPRVDMKIERAETGVNPNPLGGTLLLFIPLGLVQIPMLLKRKSEYFSSSWRFPALGLVIVILAAETIAIVLSNSFGTWLALGIALLMIGRRWRAVKAFAGLAILAVFIVFFLKPSVPIPKNDRSLRGTLLLGMDSRIPLWSAGIETVQQHPLFGVGMDRLRLIPKFKYEQAHAHNQYIHTAAEMGIPALAAYLAILMGIGWMAVEVGRSRMPKWMILSMRGLAIGQLGFSIFGFADAIALGAKPGIFFWISIAIMTSIYLIGRERGMIGSPQEETREAD